MGLVSTGSSRAALNSSVAILHRGGPFCRQCLVLERKCGRLLPGCMKSVSMLWLMRQSIGINHFACLVWGPESGPGGWLIEAVRRGDAPHPYRVSRRSPSGYPQGSRKSFAGACAYRCVGYAAEQGAPTAASSLSPFLWFDGLAAWRRAGCLWAGRAEPLACRRSALDVAQGGVKESYIYSVPYSFHIAPILPEYNASGLGGRHYGRACFFMES